MRSVHTSALVRFVVATVTCLSPKVRAAETSAVDYLTPHTVAAATVRLADAVRQPQFVFYPVEVLAAATDDFLGVPLESIERITVVVEPPMGVQPRYAAIMQTTAPISFDRFRAELTEHTESSELLGRPLLESRETLAPSLCLFDENTLAVGPRLFLKSLLRANAGPPDALLDAMTADGGQSDHVRAVVLLEPLRSFVEIGIEQAKAKAEPEAQEFLEAATLLNRVVIRSRYGDRKSESLAIHANDRHAADRLESLFAKGWDKLRQKLAEDEKLVELRDHEEATARALHSYVDRMLDLAVEYSRGVRRSDTEFRVELDKVADTYAQTYAGAVVFMGVGVALLLPAVQAAREAARRNQSLSNLTQINLAWHNYHDTHKAFPPQAVCDDDGTPLLSWRVAILPFIEEQALYQRFHLDEPWDSPHNQALLAEMPEVYLDPSSPGLVTTDGKTHYLGVSGPESALTGAAEGMPFRKLTDGTAKTMTLVQVDDEHAAPWSKPEDYGAAAHSENPVGGIGSLHPGVFLAGFADGHVEAIPLEAEPATLRALMTIAGGEAVEIP